MRNGQNNKRMRGRNRKSHNPLTRVYESNGPDVKIRGTANHVAEKYLQLARDAQSSGDPVAAENYYQHAEHYFRMIATAQEQFRQTQPFGYRPEGGEVRGADDGFDDGDDDGAPITTGGREPYGTGEQPYLPRDAQPFQPREAQPYQPRESREPREVRDGREPREGREIREPREPREPREAAPAVEANGLPAFITGGQPQQPHLANGANGHDGQPDRFPLHRRRRRHRGPRDGQPAEGGDVSSGE